MLTSEQTFKEKNQEIHLGNCHVLHTPLAHLCSTLTFLSHIYNPKYWETGKVFVDVTLY